MQSVEGRVLQACRDTHVSGLWAIFRNQFSPFTRGFQAMRSAGQAWCQETQEPLHHPSYFLYISYRTRKWEFKTPSTKADVQKTHLITLTGSLPTVYMDHFIYGILLHKHVQLPCRLQVEKFCLHATC